MLNMKNYNTLLENYIIDTSATEGYNQDTLKNIRATDLYKKLYSELVSNNKLLKTGTKSRNIKMLLEAREGYEKLTPVALQLKKVIHDLPEPETKVQRLLGAFTSTGLEFNFKEASKLPALKYESYGNGYTVTTTYIDKYSEGTDSYVKQAYQHKLNLLLQDGIPSAIRKIDATIERIKRNPNFH